MTIDEFRKKYPFIPYGTEYDVWKKTTKWYKWLLDRIKSERPAKSTDHDWCKLACWFEVELKKRNDLFKKLPKPTKEQYSDEDDPEYPWTIGKWPEDRIPDIRVFAREEDEVRELSRKVAAILTENDYCVNVLKEKTYESRKEEQEKKRRNRS